jgi:hypothetical protein
MCLQNLWAKSLNYGIRFWSDPRGKGWAEETRQGLIHDCGRITGNPEIIPR